MDKAKVRRTIEWLLSVWDMKTFELVLEGNDTDGFWYSVWHDDMGKRFECEEVVTVRECVAIEKCLDSMGFDVIG